jgi:uncharacterized protein YkwD
MRAVFIVFAPVFCAFALVSPAAATPKLSRSELSLLRAVNATRASHRLAPLRVDAALARAARSHTTEMVRMNVFAHGAFGDRMRLFHVRGPVTGENLGWGSGSYGSSRSIVQMWLNSAPHRANLLRPGFRRIGIGELVGAFQGASGATVVTADFAGR